MRDLSAAQSRLAGSFALGTVLEQRSAGSKKGNQNQFPGCPQNPERGVSVEPTDREMRLCEVAGAFCNADYNQKKPVGRVDTADDEATGGQDVVETLASGSRRR
jgi:hypothetical protein